MKNEKVTFNQYFPTFRLEVTEWNDKGDLLFRITLHTDKPTFKWSHNTIGYFILQPDKTYEFQYKNEQSKEMFAHMMRSFDPFNTFKHYHGGKR